MHPKMFVDELLYPLPGTAEQGVTASDTATDDPRWRALIKAYRGTGKARPKLIEVAEAMGWNSEQPLRNLCRELDIAGWHDVHAMVAAEPE
jgi:predicted secreted protein